jgi:hypothetical protein
MFSEVSWQRSSDEDLMGVDSDPSAWQPVEENTLCNVRFEGLIAMVMKRSIFYKAV